MTDSRMVDFRLPDLGEGLPEAEIVQWLVSEGDTVALNQVIAEVETAKAVVELPSPHAGVIHALHAAAGDVVPVGSVLVSFDQGGEDDDVVVVEEKAEQNLVGYGAAPRSAERPHRRPRSTQHVVAERITRVAIRGVRRSTADAMVRSAFTAPHVTTFLTVDVTATTALIASLKDERMREGHRIGVMAVAAKAVCVALLRHPALNSHWDADAGEIVEHHYVNLGIAAATDRGLVVPNIPDADRLNLVELADAIGELAATARAGRTSPPAMTGGTFSITNVGVFGIDAGTPILNPGEAGILALGAVRRLPWEHRGEIALRDVMTLALSFDHRLVDGEQGARFLVAVADVLREPDMAMLLRGTDPRIG